MNLYPLAVDYRSLAWLNVSIGFYFAFFLLLFYPYILHWPMKSLIETEGCILSFLLLVKAYLSVYTFQLIIR